MELEVMGREVIKPASPAPQTHIQLSLKDFSVPGIYTSPVFFYKSIAGEESSSLEIISGRLKSSLSKTLSRFYPLAGRIEGVSIKCNDEGAVFTEARTHLLLSDLLKNYRHDTFPLTKLFPQMAPEESAGTWPLLSVNVTFFGSGSGVAVTVAISHRIADAASLLTFAQDWATEAKLGEHTKLTIPQFVEATIYPPADTSSVSYPPMQTSGTKFVASRFLFKSSKISELKCKAVTQSVPVPSRVEVTTTLLFICARNASRSNSNSPAPKSTLVSIALDLRRRIPSLVLLPSAIGNLITSFYLKIEAEREMETGDIIASFRKAKDEINEIIKESLQGCNTTTLGYNLLRTCFPKFKSDVDFCVMTSWCKMPFYEVDFGLGTPVWVGLASDEVTLPVVLLMDSKNGEDVEAWVALPEQLG